MRDLSEPVVIRNNTKKIVTFTVTRVLYSYKYNYAKGDRMCEFCTQHGEAKKWSSRMENYPQVLESMSRKLYNPRRKISFLK
jgi:hypothetical protein